MKNFYGTGRGKSAWMFGPPMLVTFVKEVESRAPKNVTQFEGFKNYSQLAKRLGFVDEQYFTRLYSEYTRGARGVQPWRKRLFKVLGYAIQD
jgi:hypothetical protein